MNDKNEAFKALEPVKDLEAFSPICAKNLEKGQSQEKNGFEEHRLFYSPQTGSIDKAHETPKLCSSYIVPKGLVNITSMSLRPDAHFC